MSLQGAFKDWRRRVQLQRAGIGVETDGPRFAAGERSGVWVVDPTMLGPDSVVWSVGVGDNIAWDLAMIARFGCAVHAFDPTPRAAAWLARQDLPAGFRFHELGLAAHDGDLAFGAPADPHDVNFRPIPAGETRGTAIRAPVRRLATLAASLGHDRLDVLKIDIEGGEYEVLGDLLAASQPIGLLPMQLLIEFHHGQHGIPFARTEAALEALRAAGYRIGHISRRGLEFTLLRSGRQ